MIIITIIILYFKQISQTYTVDTPNIVSSYRLQSVVNDSDLLAGRDFVPLTHRTS